MKKTKNGPYDEALRRFQMLAPLLDPELSSGEKRDYRSKLLSQSEVSDRTLRRWLQSYRKNGFEALCSKERKDKGQRRRLSDEALELAASWRSEQPLRSAETLAQLLKHEGHQVARSTLERHLRLLGLSGRALRRERQQTTGRRFQRVQRNSLWQTDYKSGPYLPDPDHSGKKKRTQLLVFIDDATRFVVHAEFFFEQSEVNVVRGLRQAILKYGCPAGLYLDNGTPFVSEWVQLVCAKLGIRHKRTNIYSPEAKGKVERFNGTANAFLAEVALEAPPTLEALNRLWQTWLQERYNLCEHSSLEGQSPYQAFQNNPGALRHVNSERLRAALLREEERTVDKSGCIKFEGRLYDLGPRLYRKKVQLRYDPLQPETIEVWRNGELLATLTPTHIREWNGVPKRPHVNEPRRKTGSRVLTMLSKESRERMRSGPGAFLLSRGGDTE